MEESTRYEEARTKIEQTTLYESRHHGSALIGLAFGVAGVIIPFLGLMLGNSHSSQITIDVRLFSALMGVLFGAAATAAYLIVWRQRKQQSELILQSLDAAELMNEWSLFEDLSLSAASIEPDRKQMGDIRSALNRLYEQRIFTPEDLGWVQIALETRNNIAHRPQLEKDSARIRLVGRQLSRINNELRRRLTDKAGRDLDANGQRWGNRSGHPDT